MGVLRPLHLVELIRRPLASNEITRRTTLFDIDFGGNIHSHHSGRSPTYTSMLHMQQL